MFSFFLFLFLFEFSAVAMGKTKPARSQSTKQVTSKKPEAANVSSFKYRNKQRTLVFCSRGITSISRHLMQDLRMLFPHGVKDAKLDTKSHLNLVNEICETKNCNNVVFFEARKRKDLYLWVGKAPNGPSAKFLVLNSKREILEKPRKGFPVVLIQTLLKFDSFNKTKQKKKSSHHG